MAVIVYGTSNTTNASATQDPTLECFIDNISIGSSPSSNVAFNDSLNNWVLCDAGPPQLVEDGPHILTVNENISEQTFWLDQIQYAPSANVSLNQSLVRIDASDPAIQYSPATGSEWNFTVFPINYDSSTLQVAGLIYADINRSSTTTNGAFLTYE